MMFLHNSIRRNSVYHRSKHVLSNGDHQPRTQRPRSSARAIPVCRHFIRLPPQPRVPHVWTVNKLLFFFPRAAHFYHPFLVTAPIIEIIGDRGVTAADPPRIL